MAQGPRSIQERAMFFEVKRKFPNYSDDIVSQNIARAGGDGKTLEELLESSENFKIFKNNNVPTDRSPEELGAAAPADLHKIPPARCSVTGYVPTSPIRRLPFPPLNNGTSYPVPSSPNMERSIANTALEDHIKRQRRNKRNLEKELQKQNGIYEDLKKRVAELTSQLDENQASEKIKSLTKEIFTLQRDCEKLNAQVDGLTAVGGARPRKQTQVRITAVNGERIFTEEWHCEMCTFRNHHLLNQCETCCMPRINVGINAA